MNNKRTKQPLTRSSTGGPTTIDNNNNENKKPGDHGEASSG